MNTSQGNKCVFKISEEPDEFGFYTGQMTKWGEVYEVDVLPPADRFKGGLAFKGFKPDSKAWTIYVDGQFFLRASSSDPNADVFEMTETSLTWFPKREDDWRYR